jgi:transglutaminase/protease-like cytokinesis protein 3
MVSKTLLNGKEICEVYAKSMQLLLDKAGIYNYLVLGDVETDGKIEHHMWNIVNIDGKNYHLDVTWNDTTFDEEICYMYFNITDDDILKDHMNLSPSENNCNSLDMNYFSKNGILLYGFSGYNSLITHTANVLKSGQNHVEFRFAKVSDYNNAASVLKGDNQAFFDYVKEAIRQSGRNLDSNNVTYMTVDDWKYIRITFIEV